MNSNILIILILSLSLCGNIVYSRPSDDRISDIESTVDPNEYHGNLSQETIRKIQKCDQDINAMEICMRCAKVTKSQIVYPLCCDNEDHVKDWCYEYINYGA